MDEELRKTKMILEDHKERNKKLEQLVQDYKNDLHLKTTNKEEHIGDPILNEVQDQIKKIDSETTEMVNHDEDK